MDHRSLRQMEGLVSVLLGSADGVVQGGVNQFSRVVVYGIQVVGI
jgi:hypothetical protein